MKKMYVILGMLLVLGSVYGWADLIDPEFEQRLSVLRNLPREERLEKCKELGSLQMWNKHQWYAMDCDKLLPDAPNELEDIAVAEEDDNTLQATSTVVKRPSPMVNTPQQPPQTQHTSVQVTAPDAQADVVADQPTSANQPSSVSPLLIPGLVALLLCIGALLLLLHSKKTRQHS